MLQKSLSSDYNVYRFHFETKLCRKHRMLSELFIFPCSLNVLKHFTNSPFHDSYTTTALKQWINLLLNAVIGSENFFWSIPHCSLFCEDLWARFLRIFIWFFSSPLCPLLIKSPMFYTALWGVSILKLIPTEKCCLPSF